VSGPRREMSTRLKIAFLAVGVVVGALLAYLIGRL
jgi:membrane protein DedA with SNARE-associated domain